LLSTAKTVPGPFAGTPLFQTALIKKIPIIAAQQITFPSAPRKNPIIAPTPARADSFHSLPPINSNANAPITGPRINPGKLKNKPTIAPTIAPTTPRHVAPIFLAPNVLARKSRTSESTVNPRIKASPG